MTTEDIQALNDGLDALEKEKGLDIKIHVDAGESSRAILGHNSDDQFPSTDSFRWVCCTLCQA
jgi:hypothetical protein